MEDKPIVDLNTDSPKYEFMKNTTFKIGVFILGLMIANLIVVQMIPLEDVSLVKPDGSRSGVDEMRKMNVFNILLMVPFLGFTLGAVFSLLPFKKMQYKSKYLRVTLLVILTLYIFQLVSYIKALYEIGW